MKNSLRGFLGLLLTLILLLDLLPGLCVVAGAAGHTTLAKGTVILEGDTIGSFDDTVLIGCPNDNEPFPFDYGLQWTLGRQTIDSKEYYVFKTIYQSETLICPGTPVWPVTGTSDGLVVTEVKESSFSGDLMGEIGIEMMDNDLDSGLITESDPTPFYILAVHEPEPEHKHQFESTWSEDATYHWHKCTAEGAGDDCLSDPGAAKGEHAYGTEGDARFTCTVCGYVDSVKKAAAEAADKAQPQLYPQPDPQPAPQPDPPQPDPPVQPEIQEPITIMKAPSSVKAKGQKSKVEVSWAKLKKNKKNKALLKQIKSIEIQAATDPDFKDIVKIKKVGKNKTKVKLKLKSKMTYFVRVRYVGSYGYSRWSKVKKFKTK